MYGVGYDGAGIVAAERELTSCCYPAAPPVQQEAAMALTQRRPQQSSRGAEEQRSRAAELQRSWVTWESSPALPCRRACMHFAVSHALCHSAVAECMHAECKRRDPGSPGPLPARPSPYCQACREGKGAYYQLGCFSKCHCCYKD